MSKQPEALRLADELAAKADYSQSSQVNFDAAIKLRRLHAINAELLEALRKITEQHGQWNNGIWAAEVARAVIAKATGEQA